MSPPPHPKMMLLGGRELSRCTTKQIFSGCGCYVHASETETGCFPHAMETGLTAFEFLFVSSASISTSCSSTLTFLPFSPQLPSSCATSWIFSTIKKNIIKNIQKNIIVFRPCAKALERPKASQTSEHAPKQTYIEDEWRWQTHCVLRQWKGCVTIHLKKSGFIPATCFGLSKN